MINNLIEYCNQNQGLEIQDIFKYLYQSCFGCEHLVSDFEYAYHRINKEMQKADSDILPNIEMLEGDFCRVHLKALKNGLSAKTLCRLFLLSSEKQPNSLTDLEEKLREVLRLAENKLIPFSFSEIECAISSWRNAGFPPVHHSESFREHYHPAYRLIKKEYAELFPLLIEIEKSMAEKQFIIAIEGRCASGKTTLAKKLQEIYNCNVFHMDDFFLRLEQKTAERLSKPGENIDHERFLTEVILPLSKNQSVKYSRYNCDTLSLEKAVTIPQNQINIVEGVYSMHPNLADFYDLKVFLNIDCDLQRQRIEKRNSPALAKRFFNEWIPMEEMYFNNFNIRDKADLILQIK